MRVIDYGRLLLLAALWGASFLFMRITTPAFGAMNSAFLRVLFAATVLGLLLGVQGKWSGYQGKFISTLKLGVINSGLPFLMYCLAAQWLPAGYSATLNATAPMMGMLIGALCFAETVNPAQRRRRVTGRYWRGSHCAPNLQPQRRPPAAGDRGLPDRDRLLRPGWLSDPSLDPAAGRP